MDKVILHKKLISNLDWFREHCILAVAFFLPLSLPVSSGFLAFGVVSWIAGMMLTKRLELRHTPLDWMILALVVLGGISIFGSPDRGFSFYNYYHLMGRYILIYYLIVNCLNSSQSVKRLIWVLLASAIVVAGYGFYQYVHGVDVSAEWVDVEQFPGLKVRVFSTLQNPNLLAGFLVVIMSLVAGLAIKEPSMKIKVLLFVLIGVFGTCLILTYSRGAWLSLLAVVAVYGFLHNKKILWLLLLIPLVVFFYAHDSLMERIMSIMNPTDTSSTLRIALWESTLAMIMDKPLFGIGWGAYYLVYPEYDFFEVNTKIFHAHNMYLNIAAEIGIPGLIVFLIIMYGHVRKALGVLARSKDSWISGLMMGIVAAIIGLAVSGITDYVMFNIQLSMLYWMLCAIVVNVYQRL